MACSVVTWPEFGVGCGGKSELAKRILQAGIKAAAKLICLPVLTVFQQLMVFLPVLRHFKDAPKS